MDNTYIGELESVVDEVSDWAADVIKHVVDTLAPDGRGFGQEVVSMDTKLEEYRKIRNNPDAWQAWVMNKASEITNSLVTSGVQQDTLGAIKPLEIATALMLKYSADMELELNKRML